MENKRPMKATDAEITQVMDLYWKGHLSDGEAAARLRLMGFGREAIESLGIEFVRARGSV
jgi:hypothetical protein